MKITRGELFWFSKFVKDNGLENKFDGCRVFGSSIYFNSKAHNFLSWNYDANYDTLIKVVKGINAMFDLDLELIV